MNIQVTLTEVEGDKIMTAWVDEKDAIIGNTAELVIGENTTRYEITQVYN